MLPCPIATVDPSKFGHPCVEVFGPAFEVRRARREPCLCDKSLSSHVGIESRHESSVTIMSPHHLPEVGAGA